MDSIVIKERIEHLMHKYIMISLVILLITIVSHPIQSSAHSSLKGTSPADGEVIEHPLELISFEFSSKIQEGSKFTLTNQDGEIIEVERIDYEDNMMLGQLSEELKSGKYTVSYEIISEDSHVVDGDFQFSVQTGDSESPATDKETEGTSSDQEPASNESTSEEPKQGETTEGLSPVVIGISALLVVTGVAGIWWLLRKKVSV